MVDLILFNIGFQGRSLLALGGLMGAQFTPDLGLTMSFSSDVAVRLLRMTAKGVRDFPINNAASPGKTTVRSY
jgi:hypothetical protein